MKKDEKIQFSSFTDKMSIEEYEKAMQIGERYAIKMQQAIIPVWNEIVKDINHHGTSSFIIAVALAKTYTDGILSCVNAKEPQVRLSLARNIINHWLDSITEVVNKNETNK